jgi:regulation of enolase protein 1 (concanavalin A-like superfamily)
MKSSLSIHLVCLFLVSALPVASQELFRDDLKGSLAPGWSWLRENRAAWRSTEQGLEIRALPGNLWGPANNASNVLVRPLPQTTNATLEIAVTIENRPTEQYEQANLAWYGDDGNMVKLGQELVDGKLSIVMGREEKDQTRTVAIIPISAEVVPVRFLVRSNFIRGEYRLTAAPGEWRLAGECELPRHAAPQASLHVYQGPKSVERWARFTHFSIRQVEP